MELRDVINKLDTMNEHISVLRENTARMSAVLEENTRDVRNHIRRTEILEAEVQKWKGIILACTFLFGATATILQIYFK